MRPTPIPDREVWYGALRRVFAAPDGDLTNPDIAPVEVLADQQDGDVRIHVRCELEDGDLERLTAGGTVWITTWGGLLPFAVNVAGPGEPLAWATPPDAG